jgi:hydrogenase-4 component E
MSSLADSVLVVLVLSNLALLGTTSLAHSIRLLGLQGLALGALVPLFATEAPLSVALLAVGVAALKGVVYPLVLLRVLRRLKVSSDDEPLIGPSAALATGIVALAVAFALAPTLTPRGALLPTLAMPVAVSTVTAGLTVIVTRRTALAQVIGYVVLENGVFLFALSLVGGLPLVLELGGLLEVFFAVFVMGIAVDRISREFSTIDVDALGRLQG